MTATHGRTKRHIGAENVPYAKSRVKRFNEYVAAWHWQIIYCEKWKLNWSINQFRDNCNNIVIVRVINDWSNWLESRSSILSLDYPNAIFNIAYYVYPLSLIRYFPAVYYRAVNYIWYGEKRRLISLCFPRASHALFWNNVFQLCWANMYAGRYVVCIWLKCWLQ